MLKHFLLRCVGITFRAAQQSIVDVCKGVLNRLPPWKRKVIGRFF